jgi:hypothetical protein
MVWPDVWLVSWEDGSVRRAAVPPVAWLLSAGVALALLVLAAREVSAQGHGQFFHDGDSSFYLVTARSLFGNGAAFGRTGTGEAAYRYGRVGLPFLAWLLVLGRPALVGWSLIVVYLVSVAAIPGVAATLLAEYGAPPARAAFVLLAPGLLLVTDLVYAEALQIALILLACVFEARRRRGAALLILAYAILVKETSALALVPWVWSAWKRRDFWQCAGCSSVLVPYAVWAVWVRVRIGQFPFRARTRARTAALSAPGIGIGDALRLQSPNHAFIVSVTLATFAFGAVASWAARKYWIGPITAAFTVLTACFGRSALYYVLENLRLLSVPTVLAILCLVVARSGDASVAGERRPLRRIGSAPI